MPASIKIPAVPIGIRLWAVGKPAVSVAEIIRDGVHPGEPGTDDTGSITC